MQKSLSHSPMGLAISEHLRHEAEKSTTIAAEHQMVQDICNELEDIADGLPSLPRPRQLATISAALKAGIPAHCHQEEEEMRQHLSRRSHVPVHLSGAIERLAGDHAENESLGYELADLLDHVAEIGVVPNPDALGYLIRLYFQTMRRHLDWEEYVLAQLTGEVG